MLALTMLSLGLLGGVVFAASSSTSYRIPKMVIEGTGGAGSTTSYRALYNVGQTAMGNSQSSNYRAGLGFWTSGKIVIVKQAVYLPLIVK